MPQEKLFPLMVVDAHLDMTTRVMLFVLQNQMPQERAQLIVGKVGLNQDIPKVDIVLFMNVFQEVAANRLDQKLLPAQELVAILVGNPGMDTSRTDHPQDIIEIAAVNGSLLQKDLRVPLCYDKQLKFPHRR